MLLAAKDTLIILKHFLFIVAKKVIVSNYSDESVKGVLF